MRSLREIASQLEDLRARFIFFLSLVFVSLLGTLIVVWVDTVSEEAQRLRAAAVPLERLPKPA